jgi:hypothetical protein
MGFIPRAHQPTRESSIPSLEERKHHLREAWKLAAEAMEYAQSLWQKSPKFQPYHKGDKVWLEGTNLRMSHPNHKLRPKRFGPFEVTEELGPVTYQLDLPPTWRLHNAFHAALLSPYRETSEHGKAQPAPTPELVEGEPEWEIETILTSRHHGHKKELQYLVKWLGYPESDISWEPVENVHAPKLTLAFHKEHPAAAKGIKFEDISVEGGEATGPKSRADPHNPLSKCPNNPVLQVSTTSCILTKTAFPNPCCHRCTHQSTMKMPTVKKMNTDNLQRSLKHTTTPTCLKRKQSLEKKYLDWSKSLPSPKTSTRAQPWLIWDPLGSIGKKGAATWDTKSCIKAKSYNAHTFNTEYSTASLTRWEPKAEGSVSLHEKYTRALSNRWLPPMSTMMISKSSPETSLSTLRSSRRWKGWMTLGHWQKSRNSEHLMHASPSMRNLYKRYKSCSMQCINSIRPSTTRQATWSSSWRPQKREWKMHESERAFKTPSLNLHEKGNLKGDIIGQVS